MGPLTGLLRYPVKSARAEHLDTVVVEPAGLHADRTWACLDETDDTVCSAKHPRKWGRLLHVAASATSDDVTVRVAGKTYRAGTEQADAALSAHLGSPVRLSRTVPADAKLHRLLPEGLVPDWMTGRAGDELITEIGGAKPGGRFVDFGAIHLVTTGALKALAERLGRRDVPPERFRPNLIVDAAEDPEPGNELHAGEVTLRVLFPTPRCAIPGLAYDDRDLQQTLARHYRRDLPGLGRASCFGVYAEVLTPGRLHLGQNVRQGTRA